MTQYKDTIISDSGNFWDFWGSYIAEPLIPIMQEIALAFETLKTHTPFLGELQDLYKNYIGRPTPLIHAKNLSQKLWWAQIYLKNEWCSHTWAHKINHVCWQILVAKHLWKKKIIAETWAWQHWLATASACAKMWIPCKIFMGKKDYDRQRPNVYYMELAWAEVIPVYEWQQSLWDAVNAAMRYLVNNSSDTYYLLGTACGPHPYPSMNTFFQKIIWEELEKQIAQTPDYLIACLGWGSNSLGLFYNYLDNPKIQMIWVEAWGKSPQIWNHAARFIQKQKWINQWYQSYFLQDWSWQIANTHSISAWLDYAWVSPQIAYLHSKKRIDVKSADDAEVLEAFQILMQTEGILAALESCHAVAYALRLAPTLKNTQTIVVWISGRWEKDLFITAPLLDDSFAPYIHNFIKDEK